MQINSIGIIGYGDFGKLVKQVCHQFSPNTKVLISSRSNKIDNTKFFTLEEVCMADVLIPCVPISAFEGIIDRIIPLIKPDTLIVDICTVKKYPLSVLKKYSDKYKYICTHPMFGPYSYKKIGNKLDGLRVVLAESNLNTSEVKAIIKFLKILKLKVVEKSADEHDRELAQTLFLTHYISQVLIDGNFERTKIDTVSFGFLMDAVESVKNDTKLFYDVYKYNPYCKSTVEQIDISHHKIKKLLNQIKQYE